MSLTDNPTAEPAGPPGSKTSHDLEYIKLEIVGLRNVPEYRMIRRLLAGLNLTQLNARVVRGRYEHFYKEPVRHEVAA